MDPRVEGGGQYYCMTELWEDMGAPRSGRAGTTYEPQVVKRHCGHMEEDFKRMGRVHPGRVEHIDRENPDCSCEWGFGRPGRSRTSRKIRTCAQKRRAKRRRTAEERRNARNTARRGGGGFR